MKRFVLVGLLISLGFAVAVAFYLYQSSQAGSSRLVGSAPPASTLSLAILGDSDSHSYHDRVSFPAGHAQRAGAFHDMTWQWSEVLFNLRRDAVDLGAWGHWGTWWPVALLHDKLGWGGRAPAKEDFQYNFSQSGAECESLIRDRMALRLVRLMDLDTTRWTHGVVVIRIGVNSFGTREALQALSVNPDDPGVQASMTNCVGQIQQSVALIHEHHPKTNIVLVGIFDNSNWARLTKFWQSAGEKNNIAQGLNHFDQALRGMVAKDKRLAFFDDRAWFDVRWGGRDQQGLPAYRPVVLGSRYQVFNTVGDHPQHATLVDGHAGLVWNLLWAQSLVALINQSFDERIPEITDAELIRWLDHATAGRW